MLWSFSLELGLQNWNEMGFGCVLEDVQGHTHGRIAVVGRGVESYF